MCHRQAVLFKKAVSSGGYSRIDETLNSIRSERAQATVQADEDSIKQVIEVRMEMEMNMELHSKTHKSIWSMYAYGYETAAKCIQIDMKRAATMGNIVCFIFMSFTSML